jgi:hypothetical protein
MVKLSLGLKEKCSEMAEFYRRRAVIDAIQKGFSIASTDAERGTDLIDVSGDGKNIEQGVGMRNTIRLARDENGYFAVVKGRKYYPIKTSKSSYCVRNAEKYENLERSPVRRFFYAIDILDEYHLIYPLSKISSDISDFCFEMEGSFLYLSGQLKHFAVLFDEAAHHYGNLEKLSNETTSR